MRSSSYLFFAVELLLLCSAVYSIAADAQDGHNSEYWYHDIATTAGLGYSRMINSPDKKLVVTPYLTDELQPSRGVSAMLLNLELKKIMQLPVNKIFRSMAIGPSYYYQHHSLNGEVWELGLREFDNYHYKFTSDLSTVLLEADIFMEPIYRTVTPFLTAGVGVAIANIQYDDYANAGIPVTSELHVNSRYEFDAAYAVGAGLSLPVNTHWRLALRYVYLYAGNVNSATAGLNAPQAPIKANLNSQALLLNLSYLN